MTVARVRGKELSTARLRKIPMLTPMKGSVTVGGSTWRVARQRAITKPQYCS